MTLKYTYEAIDENQYKITHDQVESLFTPPIRKILQVFSKYDFEVRVVGGSIRDMLLGLLPRDTDLATSALPDETIFILVLDDIDVDAGGIEHGTIKAVIDEEKYEITSIGYQIKQNSEGNPVVHTSQSWDEDAARRDYTINSLSMDLQGNIFDYVGGLKDLENQIIRGNIGLEEKIQTDPNVILRGFKLISKFENPKITKRTKAAWLNNIELLAQVRPSVIGWSLMDIIKSPRAHKVLALMAKWGALKAFNLRDDNIDEVIAKYQETRDSIEALKLMTTSMDQIHPMIEHYEI